MLEPQAYPQRQWGVSTEEEEVDYDIGRAEARHGGSIATQKVTDRKTASRALRRASAPHGLQAGIFRLTHVQATLEPSHLVLKGHFVPSTSLYRHPRDVEFPKALGEGQSESDQVYVMLDAP